MRIALLGSRGYIGREFASQLEQARIDFVPVLMHEYDLVDPARLTRRLESIGATGLINCAGYTGKPNVDACEYDKANCLAGNAVLPGTIRAACEALGIVWGHISSGCIYTGRPSDGGGFTETDLPNFTFRQDNCSFYSGTKALGEEVLRDADGCYVWRLRIPFSNVDSPRNYLSKLMRYDRLLDAENSISDLNELVRACIDCLVRELPTGIYNLTNPGAITTREVTELLRFHGLTDKRFSFFEDEAEFMQQAASAPRSNCVLDSSKALNAGLELTEVQAAISRALEGWQSRN